MLREILNAGKTGLAADTSTLMEGRYFFRSVGDDEKELTGALPLRFRSNGSDLLDWRITGAEGGSGRPGKNYLKMKELEVSDGGDGTIKYSYSTMPAVIPDGASNKADYQQWVTPVYSRYWTKNSYRIVYDDRVPGYDTCLWFADLKAGTYKLMAEFYSSFGEFNMYGGSWYRLNDPWGAQDKYPHVSLFKQGADTPFFAVPVLEGKTAWKQDNSFIHEEYLFTLDEDTKIGFFGVFPGESRFMIVDEDVQATLPARNSTDKTCWEPFHYELPITITSGDESVTVVIDLGQELLGPEDSVSLADKGVRIPTYSGWNTIDSDVDNKPSGMYIKYRG